MHQLTEPQKQWIAALRSGEYKQCKTQLHDGHAYCCLGVACEIAKANGVNVVVSNNGNILGGSLQVQPKVREWLGLASNSGHSKNDKKPALTTLNDSYEMPFNEIADHIEKYAEELFV